MTLKPWCGEKAWSNAFLKAISRGHFFDLLFKAQFFNQGRWHCRKRVWGARIWKVRYIKYSSCRIDKECLFSLHWQAQIERTIVINYSEEWGNSNPWNYYVTFYMFEWYIFPAIDLNATSPLRRTTSAIQFVLWDLQFWEYSSTLLTNLERPAA